MGRRRNWKAARIISGSKEEMIGILNISPPPPLFFSLFHILGLHWR